MPRIRMITLSAGPEGTRDAGGEYTVSDAEATALVDGGYATLIEEERSDADAGQGDPPPERDVAQRDRDAAGDVEVEDAAIREEGETTALRPRRTGSAAKHKK